MSAALGYNYYKENILPKIKNDLDGISQGQSPHTLFITCSDSRICPNLLTNTKHGELFVIRNAGNSIPHVNDQGGDSDIATLEFAVKALKVKEIIVCGHSHCGAINALISGVDSNFLPRINEYLKRLESLKFEFSRKEVDLNIVIKKNILKQLENIASHQFVKEAIEKGGLQLRGWLYHLDTGEVDFIKESFDE